MLALTLVLSSILNYCSSASISNCSSTEDFEPKNLTFPGGKVGQLTNLTWGINEFGCHLQNVSSNIKDFSS